MKNCIYFKGNSDGINIVLDENCSFSDILDELQKKIDDSKQYFGGSTSNIQISGRTLTKDEEDKIFNIICTTANLDINFIGTEKFFSVSKQKPTEKIIEKIVEKVVEVPSSTNFSSKKNSTYFYEGTLRSGDTLNYEGSIVILGDTNPGSKVTAYGNIIVQGKIGGVVHAGCLGDKNCYITAYNLSPNQLRIADKIIAIPPEILKENKSSFIPRQAFIKDDQITIKNILKKF